MHKPVKDCLQQVRSIERRNARPADEFALIRHKDMGRVFGIERINIAPVDPAQGVPALQVDKNLMTQAEILFQQRVFYAIFRRADDMNFHCVVPLRCLHLGGIWHALGGPENRKISQ